MNSHKSKRGVIFCALLISALFVLAGAGVALCEGLPENLAPRATITSDSEYSPDYAARFVADGRVTPAGGGGDPGEAWCVVGETHRNGAMLQFVWKEPVSIACVVYYGRTAWMMTECWKDYEVLSGNPPSPVCSGRLEMRHGPQFIIFPSPVSTNSLTLRFTSSYGGANPGASEAQVFGSVPSQSELDRLIRRQALASMPQIDNVDPAGLKALIKRLGELHGSDYRLREEHLRRLAEAENRPASRPSASDDLVRLQREVLLFDVERLLIIKRFEITASHVYTYHYEGFRPGGGLYIIPLRETHAPLELVSSHEGQILDCDLSFDGKTALFSWRRKAEEGYHLWQVGVDGSGLKQLTDGPWHDYNACWLPDGGVAFLSTRSPQFAYCWHAPVGVVHRMDADGANVRRLSANYLNDFTPYVLDDGRIIYSRWEYVDKPAIPIQSLWTINPDGTGLAGYFGNRVISPGTFMEARQIPGTEKIVCTMTGHNGPTRGALGVIDRSRGVNAQEAITNITPDVPVPSVNAGNGNTDGAKQYSSPIPLDAERLLCSIKGPLLVRTFSCDCQSLVLEAPEDGMQYFCAQPVRARRRPPAIPSTLAADSQRAGRATVYLQDVYAGLEPVVKRGEVNRIRVVRETQKTVRVDPNLRAFGFQFPVISCGATYAAKDVIGEVPVSEDGSACFNVPAESPIYFMVLDSKGRALQRMRSFTHLMPGETQGCVGCHEPRLQTPARRLSPAVNECPLDLEPPEWGAGGFSYTDVVQPVLDRHCVRCHNSLDAPTGVDLTGGRTDYFNVSYETLARDNQGPAGSPYVNWIPTYNGQEQNILEVTPKAWGSPRSRLAEIVLSSHPDKDGKPRIALRDAERRRILAWIDLNVPYYSSSETAYPEMVGCRRIYPDKLDAVLSDVAARRCAHCHEGGRIPRREWTRITEPHLNNFLLAPLAKSAGGTQKCGEAVFKGKDDPDYRAMLATFDPVLEMLRKRPRMDMPGGRPAENVCRDRK